MQEKFQERMTDFSGRKLSLQESQLDIRRTWNGGKGKDPGVDAEKGVQGGVGFTGTGVGAGTGADAEMGVVGTGVGIGRGLDAAWMRRGTEVAGGGAGTDRSTEGAVTVAAVAEAVAETGTEVVYDMICPSTHPYSHHLLDGKDRAVESNIGDLQQADMPDISLLLTSDYEDTAATAATNTTTANAAAAVSDLKRTEIVDRKCSANPPSSSHSSPSFSTALASSIKKHHPSDTTAVCTDASVRAGEEVVTASKTLPSSSPPPSSPSSSSSSSSSPSASPSAGTDTHPTTNITPHNGDLDDSALSPFLTVQAGSKYVPSVFPHPVIPSHVTIEHNNSSSSSNSNSSSSSSNSHSPSLPD